MVSRILTIGETAEDLGLNRETVRDAMNRLKIVPKKVPHNGNAKGLDDDDRARIAALFAPVEGEQAGELLSA